MKQRQLTLFEVPRKSFEWDILNFIWRGHFISREFLLIEFHYKGPSLIDRIIGLLFQHGYIKKMQVSMKSGETGCLMCLYYLSELGGEAIGKGGLYTNIKPNFSDFNHNLVVFKLIKSLHLPRNSYGTPMEILKQKSEIKGIPIYANNGNSNWYSLKSVDFICEKGAGKIGCEVELNIKTISRYYGSKRRVTVFGKINQDFKNTMYKKIVYYLPNQFINRFKTIVEKCPVKYRLNLPYEIVSIESINSSIFSKHYSLSDKKRVLNYKTKNK